MLPRRAFLLATGAGLAAPAVLRRPAQAAGPRLRRDVTLLADDDPFFAKYADAVRAMHAQPPDSGRNWARQARIHADFCVHGRLSFLHWHRHYLSNFESICAELIGDDQFALPYWNWTARSGVIPAPFYDLDALNVEFWNDPGQYDGIGWGPVDSVARRGLTKGRGLLADPQRGGSFTRARIDGIKRLGNPNLFQRSLEGSPHNDGHVIAGATATGKVGHIGDGLSPLDPIFWLHHCMVDRIWAEWQAAGNATPDPGETYAGQFFDRSGTPVQASSAAALDIANFGYSYDVLQPATAGGPQAFAAAPQLIGPILPELERSVRAPTAPAVLGSASSAEVSAPLVATAVKVPTTGLLAAASADRAFRGFSIGQQPMVGVESKRILALIGDIAVPPGAGDLVVNVFVNCPYLSPATPYTDPYYAGTFSFFGARSHSSHEREFVIDITEPVRTLARAGRISDQQLTIQLMPLPAYMEAKSGTTFQAKRIQIVAV